MSTIIRKITVDELHEFILDNPNLTAAGYDPTDRCNYAKYRPWMYDDKFLREVQLCYEWLEVVDKIKSIQYSTGSYGLKHRVEDSTNIYISNGAFISAAIMKGFDWTKTLNPNFNMSKKSLKIACAQDMKQNLNDSVCYPRLGDIEKAIV